jgi:hypothetical protein
MFLTTFLAAFNAYLEAVDRLSAVNRMAVAAASGAPPRAAAGS